MGNDKAITKTNLTITIITIAICLLKFIELSIIASKVSASYTYGDMAIIFLLIMVYIILFAYLSRFVGMKKGIQTGYAWGYCLGIIGFIVVCALKEENIKKVNTNDKYEELEKLQKLKTNGILTEDEFEKEKQKLLN